jgi:hypothetical protein
VSGEHARAARRAAARRALTRGHRPEARPEARAGARPGARRREVLALLGLLAAAWWFLGPAEQVARSMVEARARSQSVVEATYLIQACVTAAADPGAALPAGEQAAQAAALLERLLEIEAARATWPQRTLTVLDDDQVAAIKEGTDHAQVPRSRSHPYIPGELLLIETLLSERFGSTPAAAPPPLPDPADTPWPGANPLDIQRGLLTLIERDQPPLTPEQGAQILAALLPGLRAHQELPDLKDRLSEALGPDVRRLAEDLSRTPIDADAAMAHAPIVIELLRERAQ